MDPLQGALIALGVDSDDLAALMAWAPYRGLGLAERVYRSGLVSDHRMVEAFVGLGAVDATADVLRGTPPPAALGAFTRALAERHRALPLAIERRRLIVALLDPSDTATLEKLSFTCGLIIEPRSCRGRVLFEGLARAYDAVVVKPDAAFLESRRKSVHRPGDEDLGFDLPPPSTDAAAQAFVRRPSANLSTSPMAKAITEVADVEAGEGIDIDLADGDSGDHQRPHLLSTSAAAARDLRPASTPRLSDEALAKLATASREDVVGARDSLPPMVLRLLVPPLRSCALFVVRKNIAVGWDVRTASGGLTTDGFRDVLVPLTAESVLATAYETARAAIGQPRDPTTMERTLFRFLRMAPPRSFAALPVLVGEEVVALLYADSDTGLIDDAALDEMRRVGTALGDALAPLVAIGLLEGAPADGEASGRPDTDSNRHVGR